MSKQRNRPRDPTKPIGIARLEGDLITYLQDRTLDRVMICHHLNLPTNLAYSFRGPHERISAILYGSVLEFLNVPLREPFYYKPKHPAAKWGTTNLIVDHEYIKAKLIDQFGWRGHMDLTRRYLNHHDSNSQTRNFFEARNHKNRMYYLWDRVLVGSLLAMIGATPPAPFWLRRGQNFIDYMHEREQETK